jgi:hypothetical protein
MPIPVCEARESIGEVTGGGTGTGTGTGKAAATSPSLALRRDFLFIGDSLTVVGIEAISVDAVDDSDEDMFVWLNRKGATC